MPNGARKEERDKSEGIFSRIAKASERGAHRVAEKLRHATGMDKPSQIGGRKAEIERQLREAGDPSAEK